MTPRTLTVAAAALLALPLASCNIIGPAYLLVHGPEKTPAVHKLEKERSTVIFVDDRANVLSRRALRTQIAKSAESALLKEGVLTNVVDATAAMQVALRESAGEPMAISTLGQSVQADVVIYVIMDSFLLSNDGQTFTPQATAHVKVIDSTSQKRLFPEKKEGHPVTVTIKMASGTVPRTQTDQINALNALADATGQQIARLFYDAETRESISQGK
jgi:hypothetical protein